MEAERVRKEDLDRKHLVIERHRRAGALTIGEAAEAMDLIEKDARELTGHEAEVWKYLEQLVAGRITPQQYVRALRLIPMQPAGPEEPTGKPADPPVSRPPDLPGEPTTPVPRNAGGAVDESTPKAPENTGAHPSGAAQDEGNGPLRMRLKVLLVLAGVVALFYVLGELAKPSQRPFPADSTMMAQPADSTVLMQPVEPMAHDTTMARDTTR
jgi:hypothetical protein